MAKQDGPGPEKTTKKKRAEDAKRQRGQHRQNKTAARKEAKPRGETTPTGATNFYTPTQRKKTEFDDKYDSCTKLENSKSKGKRSSKRARRIPEKSRRKKD